jgi:hypothetical protein
VSPASGPVYRRCERLRAIRPPSRLWVFPDSRSTEGQMQCHRNARLGLAGRHEFGVAIEQRCSISQAARRSGVAAARSRQRRGGSRIPAGRCPQDPIPASERDQTQRIAVRHRDQREVMHRSSVTGTVSETTRERASQPGDGFEVQRREFRPRTRLPRSPRPRLSHAASRPGSADRVVRSLTFAERRAGCPQAGFALPPAAVRAVLAARVVAAGALPADTCLRNQSV